MDFSRYPITKSNEGHFYVDSFESVEINLENLQETSLEIQEGLKSIFDYLYFKN